MTVRKVLTAPSACQIRIPAPQPCLVPQQIGCLEHTGLPAGEILEARVREERPRRVAKELRVGAEGRPVAEEGRVPVPSRDAQLRETCGMGSEKVDISI